MKNIKIVIMMLLSFCLLSNFVTAETEIEVDVQPAEPAPASSITITASITSEKNIDRVYIEMQECKEDLCFQKDNVSMTKTNNNYQKQYQLVMTEATYFKYSLAILFEDGSWFNQSEKTEITLKPSSNGTNGGNNGGNDSPGFELILLFAAISLTIVLFRRKRLK